MVMVKASPEVALTVNICMLAFDMIPELDTPEYSAVLSPGNPETDRSIWKLPAKVG